MRAFRNYLIASVLVLATLFVYIPVHYQIHYPRDIRPPLDKFIRHTFQDALNEKQPEVLLFGDSMLAPAVDETVVANQLGKKTMLSSRSGSAFTIWYAIIKNDILHAEHKPSYLVIFFRDSMMTVPGYKVNGRYLEQVDEFASLNDTLLIERAYLNQMTPLEKIMEKYVPLYGSRWTIRRSIDYYVRYSLPNLLRGCNSSCTDLAMDAVFKTDNLDINFLSRAIDVSDEYLYAGKALNFDEQIDKSFLPEVIRLCKENNIQLLFIRMPILRFEEPGTQPKGLNAYMERLANYSEQNSIPYFDFDRKEMTSEYFSDPLHLNEQGKVIFTEWLTEALKTVIK